eukprot:scaffold42432_cov38-Phaeocystis_antarctica.AAC.1
MSRTGGSSALLCSSSTLSERKQARPPTCWSALPYSRSSLSSTSVSIPSIVRIWLNERSSSRSRTQPLSPSIEQSVALWKESS